jgi:hypothetical protein
MMTCRWETAHPRPAFPLPDPKAGKARRAQERPATYVAPAPEAAQLPAEDWLKGRSAHDADERAAHQRSGRQEGGENADQRIAQCAEWQRLRLLHRQVGWVGNRTAVTAANKPAPNHAAGRKADNKGSREGSEMSGAVGCPNRELDVFGE